jgi:hypothetical protein
LAIILVLAKELYKIPNGEHGDFRPIHAINKALDFIRKTEHIISSVRYPLMMNPVAGIVYGHAPIGPSYSGVKIEHLGGSSGVSTPIKSIQEDFPDKNPTSNSDPNEHQTGIQRGAQGRLEFTNQRVFGMQNSQSAPQLQILSNKPGPRSFEEWRKMEFVTEGTEDVDELDCIGSVSLKASVYLEKNRCGRSRVTASHGTSLVMEPNELSGQRRGGSTFEDRVNVIIRKKAFNESPVLSSQSKPSGMVRPQFHSDQANDSKRVIGLVHESPSMTPSKKMFFDDRVVPEETAAHLIQGNFTKVKMSGRIGFG